MTQIMQHIDRIPADPQIGDILLKNGSVRATWSAFGWMLWHRKDDGVGLSLDRLGEYAMQELQFLAEWTKPGHRVIDVGAYIGTHTLMFARKVAPTGQVTALEPNRQAYQMLCANLMMNGITGVRTAPTAAGEKEGSFLLPMLDDEKVFDRGMFNIRTLPAQALGQTRVGILPLDKIETPRCDVIKLNAPGYTMDVLNGALNLLQRTRPVCFVTVYSKADQQSVQTLLDDMGYAAFSFTSPWYRPDNLMKEPRNPFPNAVRHAVFAVPEPRRAQAEALLSDQPYGLKGL